MLAMNMPVSESIQTANTITNITGSCSMTISLTSLIAIIANLSANSYMCIGCIGIYVGMSHVVTLCSCLHVFRVMYTMYI